MPELQHDLAALGVDRVGYLPPALYLLGRPNTGGVRVADAHRCDRGGFADDQACVGPLGVVLDNQVTRHAARLSAATGQRGHDDAVGQFQFANLDRVEKCGHSDAAPYKVRTAKLRVHGQDGLRGLR